MDILSLFKKIEFKPIFSNKTGKLVFLFFLCSFFLTCSQALAAQVTVTFEPSPDSRVIGYKLYYGTSSRNYNQSIDLGGNTSQKITNLQGGKIYYFAATAYDANGHESGFSQELAANIPAETEDKTDLDGDGISDSDETNIYGTDPEDADTDDDKCSDGEELAYWGDSWDSDNDGDGKINLLDYDSDNDGICDGEERKRNSSLRAVVQLLLN